MRDNHVYTQLGTRYRSSAPALQLLKDNVKEAYHDAIKKRAPDLKPEMRLMMGLPASGKSSYVEHYSDFQQTHYVIDPDNVRQDLIDAWRVVNDKTTISQADLLQMMKDITTGTDTSSFDTSILGFAIQRGIHIVYHVSDEDSWYETIFSNTIRLEQKYTFHAHVISASWESILSRNVARGAEGIQKADLETRFRTFYNYLWFNQTKDETTRKEKLQELVNKYRSLSMSDVQTSLASHAIPDNTATYVRMFASVQVFDTNTIILVSSQWGPNMKNVILNLVPESECRRVFFTNPFNDRLNVFKDMHMQTSGLINSLINKLSMLQLDEGYTLRELKKLTYEVKEQGSRTSFPSFLRNANGKIKVHNDLHKINTKRQEWYTKAWGEYIEEEAELRDNENLQRFFGKVPPATLLAISQDLEWGTVATKINDGIAPTPLETLKFFKEFTGSSIEEVMQQAIRTSDTRQHWLTRKDDEEVKSYLRRLRNVNRLDSLIMGLFGPSGVWTDALQTKAFVASLKSEPDDSMVIHMLADGEMDDMLGVMQLLQCPKVKHLHVYMATDYVAEGDLLREQLTKLWLSGFQETKCTIHKEHVFHAGVNISIIQEHYTDKVFANALNQTALIQFGNTVGDTAQLRWDLSHVLESILPKRDAFFMHKVDTAVTAPLPRLPRQRDVDWMVLMSTAGDAFESVMGSRDETTIGVYMAKLKRIVEGRIFTLHKITKWAKFDDEKVDGLYHNLVLPQSVIVYKLLAKLSMDATIPVRVSEIEDWINGKPKMVDVGSLRCKVFHAGKVKKFNPLTGVIWIEQRDVTGFAKATDNLEKALTFSTRHPQTLGFFHEDDTIDWNLFRQIPIIEHKTYVRKQGKTYVPTNVSMHHANTTLFPIPQRIECLERYLNQKPEWKVTTCFVTGAIGKSGLLRKNTSERELVESVSAKALSLDIRALSFEEEAKYERSAALKQNESTSLLLSAGGHTMQVSYPKKRNNVLSKDIAYMSIDIPTDSGETAAQKAFETMCVTPLLPEYCTEMKGTLSRNSQIDCPNRHWSTPVELMHDILSPIVVDHKIPFLHSCLGGNTSLQKDAFRILCIWLEIKESVYVRITDENRGHCELFTNTQSKSQFKVSFGTFLHRSSTRIKDVIIEAIRRQKEVYIKRIGALPSLDYPTMVIPVGVPGSGKGHYLETHRLRYQNYLTLDPDKFRSDTGIDAKGLSDEDSEVFFNQSRISMVGDKTDHVKESILYAAIQRKIDFIYDAPNDTAKFIVKTLLRHAVGTSYTFQTFVMMTPPRHLVEHIEKRKRKEGRGVRSYADVARRVAELFGIPRTDSVVMNEEVAKDENLAKDSEGLAKYYLNHCTLPESEDFKKSFENQLRDAARREGIMFPSSFPIEIVVT